MSEAFTELQAEGLRFTFRRPRAGVLLVAISGDDRNQLGRAPLEVLDAELSRHWPLELFVDTREALGASTVVREAWTGWFQQSAARLSRVHIIANSRHVNVSVGVAKLFSRTGELIRIYTEPRNFEQALAVASGRVPSR